VHRDRYLEQQQTEKIETEMRDGDVIRITKMYACCPGWPSEELIRALQSNINIYYSPKPAAPLLQLKLCLAAGRAGIHENGQPLTTQSVWYTVYPYLIPTSLAVYV
jgi:hypothetical protein